MSVYWKAIRKIQGLKEMVRTARDDAHDRGVEVERLEAEVNQLKDAWDALPRSEAVDQLIAARAEIKRLTTNPLKDLSWDELVAGACQSPLFGPEHATGLRAVHDDGIAEGKEAAAKAVEQLPEGGYYAAVIRNLKETADA